MFCALHDQLASLGRHAQLTRCFSAAAELLVALTERIQISADTSENQFTVLHSIATSCTLVPMIQSNNNYYNYHCYTTTTTILIVVVVIISSIINVQHKHINTYIKALTHGQQQGRQDRDCLCDQYTRDRQYHYSPQQTVLLAFINNTFIQQ